MRIEITTKAQFDQEFASGEVLVDFYATWCGPCKMLAPIIEGIADEIEDLKVLSVDVDEVPTAAAMFNVQSIPTLIHAKDGKVLGSRLGYMPKPAVLSFIGR